MTRPAAIIYKEQRYLYLGMAVLLILVAVYIYFVSATVMHVVVRKDTMGDVSAVNSDISKLEATYIAAQHAVSADLATQAGFVVSDEKVFLSRSPDRLVLSLAFD